MKLRIAIILIVLLAARTYASCEGDIVEKSYSGSFEVIKIETPKYSCKVNEKYQYRDKYIDVLGSGCVVELKVVKVAKKIDEANLPLRVYLGDKECAQYKVGQRKN